MQKAIATMMILAGGLFAAPAVRVGIGIAVPAQVAVVRPACPGPGYTWVDGYYAPSGVWVAGYWAPPAVVTVAPRFAPAPIIARHLDHDRFDHFRR
jgi:WXXGXW repeat (2 copies)